MQQLRIRGRWGHRRLCFGLHNAIGIVLLFALALLAATATVPGFEDQFAPVIYRLADSHPIHATRCAVREPQDGSTTITPDEAVAIARGYLPGAVPYRVQMPKYGGVYQIALLYPQDKVHGDRVRFELTTGEWRATGTKMVGALELKSLNDRRTARVPEQGTVERIITTRADNQRSGLRRDFE